MASARTAVCRKPRAIARASLSGAMRKYQASPFHSNAERPHGRRSIFRAQSPSGSSPAARPGSAVNCRKSLLARGYRVVVTARDKAKIDDIVERPRRERRWRSSSTSKSRRDRRRRRGGQRRFGRIDVLVNNAGYGYLAAVEEGDDADIRAMFETNFFGLAALTRAVLPIMRAQKSGAIVNVSSMGGFIGFPGSGYYAATKFAVEGLSESLSKEVGPLGIKVIIVEPGPFRTDWAGRSLKTPETPDRRLRRDRDRAPATAPSLSAASSPAIPSAEPRRSSPPSNRRSRRCGSCSAASPTRRWARRSRRCARNTRRARRRRAGRTIRRRAERRAGLRQRALKRSAIMTDRFNLERFVEAQAPVYDHVAPRASGRPEGKPLDVVCLSADRGPWP